MLLYENAASPAPPKSWPSFPLADSEARSPRVRFTSSGDHLVAYGRLDVRVSEEL